jgi:hypothetical protein
VLLSCRRWLNCISEKNKGATTATAYRHCKNARQWDGPTVLLLCQRSKSWQEVTKVRSTPWHNPAIVVVGIDIGKNSFHVVGHDERGAIWELKYYLNIVSLSLFISSTNDYRTWTLPAISISIF